MALQVNGTNIADVKYNTNTVINKVQINSTTAWLSPFTYTRGTLPTGVASITFQIVTGGETMYGNRTVSSGGAIYYGEKPQVTATASSGYNAPTVSGVPASVTGNMTGTSYVTAGGPSGPPTATKTITGSYGQSAGDGYYTPLGSMTTTAGSVSTRTFDSAFNEWYSGVSLGYKIYKGGVLKMSGTTSGFTLTSTQRGYLNGTGQIRVGCTTAGNRVITNEVKLTVTYTY